MAKLSLNEFADKMSEVMPAIMKEFAKRQAGELYQMKITIPQFLMLMLLQKEGEAKMTALAHFMNVTTAAMTGMVDRLVRDGYLVRTFNPQDRRIIKVRLSVKGSQLVKKINEQRRKMIIKIFGRICASDRQAYLRILMRIRDILTKEKEV